jgi:hypothetical protein
MPGLNDSSMPGMNTKSRIDARVGAAKFRDALPAVRVHCGYYPFGDTSLTGLLQEQVNLTV